jgi:hypothetical protein
MEYISRENWLAQAIIILGDTFRAKGYKLPAVKVSVGIPFSRAGLKAIGQHWSPKASDDKRGSIFISPVVDDGRQVLSVLVHELVHAAVGNDQGHGKVFRECAEKIGLVGKMTATIAGPELVPILDAVIKRIGKYPHAKLNLRMRPTKRQSTRNILMECLKCGYKARTARTNIETHGPVICPCNKKPMKVK